VSQKAVADNRRSGPARLTKASEENPMLPANSAESPHYPIRTTIRIIIVAVGVMIVAMWALVGASLVNQRQTALDAASSEGRNLMIAFREEVAAILRGVDGETNLIAARMRDERGNFDLYAWGQQSEHVTPGIARAVIVDPDGKLSAATADRHSGPIDLSDREYFRIHLDGKFRGLYIGQSIVGRILGVPVVPISRRVEAEDGTFLGVVVVLISPSALTTLPKSIDLGPHGVMTLAGLDSIIRARFTADSLEGTSGIGVSLAGGSRPTEIKENTEGRYMRASLVDAIPRVYAYGRVGSYPLVVTVGLDLDQKLAAWRSYATMIVAMTLAATVLLVGLAAYLIRRMVRDARAARASTLAITHTAEHDFLTGLPNRMLLNDRVGQAIAAAPRHQNRVAVLFLDLDGFKRINDSLGHPIGDQLLQSVATRLVACVRRSDTVSRQGGDEFVALLSEVRQPEDAAIVARKMLQAVAQAHSIGQHDLRVTASIGVSIYPEDGGDAETLLKNADTAMYQAKAAGRQRYQFFEPALDLLAVGRQSIETDLQGALEPHEL
jgi:diguanylate cyclase (GGDEF)-like protein